jgi:hypothetical protein
VVEGEQKVAEAQKQKAKNKSPTPSQILARTAIKLDVNSAQVLGGKQLVASHQLPGAWAPRRGRLFGQGIRQKHFTTPAKLHNARLSSWHFFAHGPN